MGSIIGNFFGSATSKSADETIAFSSITAASGFAAAYLGATLDSVTPEVRRLYSEYCTQNVMGQEALTALAVKKGWVKPYEQPTQQLQNSLSQAQQVVKNQ